jgi:NAD(P)-dependent dehydrogenase (short-subunit alcohol dehydrogenase family)
MSDIAEGQVHRSDDLAGKACIVIGGGSIAPGWGIGKAISVAYARAGAKVMVCDRSFEAASETASIIESEGGTAVSYALNATDMVALRDVVEQTKSKFGSVDVLHNNVGIGKAGDSSETSPEEWRAIADANLLALHIATQAVLPVMKQQRSGVILTTSTVGSLRYLGFPHLAYNVTKAAANHFSRLVAAEYAQFGIRANTLIAGLMDTPRIRVTLAKTYATSDTDMMQRRSNQVPLGFMGDGWDVAHAAVFLASDKARYISGAELVIDGALTATTRT